MIAAIGGGSNAMGLFYPFLDDKSVAIIGVEAGGKGVNAKIGALRLADRRAPGRAARQPHLSASGRRRPDPRGLLDLGRARLSRASARNTAWLHDVGRAQYVAITDREALEAFQLLCGTEGIIPALEPSHALAHVMKIAPGLPKDHLIVMNLCGRGDKDIFTVAKALGTDMSGLVEGRDFSD